MIPPVREALFMNASADLPQRVTYNFPFEERTMRGNEALEQSSYPHPTMRSSLPEEMSELDEEPDQQSQDRQPHRLVRNKKMILVILCVALLEMLLGILLLLFTRDMLPLFGTLVVVFLLYRRIDVYLDTTATHLH
jgi:hypothetical protein